MFGIGPGELIVIILVALVVLGPEKLPAAARVLGRLSGEMRRLSTEFQRALHEAADPAPPSTRTAGPDHSDEKAAPRPAPEPDALETADTVPAGFAGIAEADAGKAAASAANAPDNESGAAPLRPEERGRT